MILASCRVTLRLSDSHSLKDKRQVVSGLLRRLRDRHNVSAIELDGHDVWQTAILAVALAARDRGNAEICLARVRRDIEDLTQLKHIEFESSFQ